MPDRPNKETIFNQACEIEGDSERAAFVANSCGDDKALKAEIEQLLELDDQQDSLLDFELINLDQTSDSFPILEKTGDEIGPFKLLQKVGEGGMGVVYMAEQKVPIRRRVALKIIKPGMDTREVVARFEAERQALAMMDHPNIAKVLDCGATTTGRPYFVMELVKGVSITKYCDANHLTPKERLELFVPVCQAIQHAHQKGIIHRDMKPSNILIAEYDHTPVPKIIDFGVAKALNQQLTEKTMFTQLGQIIGTIEYMSPEQAKVNQLDVDTRSDIYSLGVLLYELLSGSTPFDKKRMRSVAIDELMRIIREEDPPRPSTRLSTIETLPSIAANRKTEPKKLSTLLTGELDWIVMKAMEKDRGRRYDTASAFADDIQNYLNDEAVLACPPSASYRFRKFARRNKATLLTGSIVATTLILGIIGTSWQAVRASQSAERERDAKQIAQNSLVAEKVARQDAERARIEEVKQREIAVNERHSAEQARDAAETEAVRANTVVDVLKELFASSNSNDEFARPANYTVREFLINMADRLPERLKDQPEVEAEVRALIGRALTSFLSFNEISQATDQLKVALKLRREVYGDLHSKTIDSILDLADFYWIIGARTKCIEQARKAFEVSRQFVNDAPADPSHVNLRLRSIRSSLRHVAWHEKLSLCEEAIGLARNHSANDNPHLAEILRVFAESKWNEHQVRHAKGAKEQTTSMNAVMSCAEIALAENTKIFGREHPKTAACLALLGQLELANANRDSAEQYFRNSFQIQKKFKSGGTTSTLRRLNQVLSKDEFDTLVNQNYLFGGGGYLMSRAFEQFNKGNLSEYQLMISRLVENYDDGGIGPWYLANACSLSEHAVKDWSPVIELIRNSKSNSAIDESERLAMLGSVLLRAGKTNEAVKALTYSTKTWKPLKGTLFEDSFALPDVWAYELMLAMALHAEDNTEEAKQQFIQVANEASRFLVGREFNAAGNIRLKLVLLMGEAQSLLEISPQSFGIEPNNPWSYVARGQLYQTEGDAEKAIADFGHAIDLQPDNVYLLTLRAKALRASGKPDLAIADCNQVLELQPGNVGGHDVRGQCLNDLEQFEEAIADFSQAIESNPNHSWSYHHRADCFKKLEQLERAIADYTRAIDSKPDFVWSYQHRGDCYQSLGQYENAIVDYETALELRNAQPNDLLAKLIACYQELDQLDDLIKRLDEIVGDETTDAEYWHRRGDFLRTLKRPKQAIKSYSKALEINPEHGWARINRSNSLTKSNSNQYAVDDYEQTIDLDNLTKTKMPFGRFCFEVGERLLRLEQYEMASDILEKAIDIEPGKTHFRKRAALAHFHLDQFVEAIDDLKIRVEKSPDDTSTIVWISPDKVAACKDESFKTELLKLSDRLFELSERKQWVLYDRGWILLKCGNLEGAEECFDGAIARTPNDTNLCNNIGVLYSNFGNHKKAQDLFSKAIKLDGQQSRAWNLRGLSYFRMGQFDKARKDFAKFAELKPQNPVARSNQAAALFELGDFEQSIAVADAAIKLSPNHAHSLQVRAKSQVALQRWSDAIDDYTQLIEIEPEKLEHLAARGKAYSGAGEQEKSDADFAKYIASFDKLVEVKPDDWQTFNRRGVAKTKIERWEQAIKDFNKSLELAPQEIVIWKNLANCYCEQGDWKSAIGKLAKALELGDENWLTYYHMALCQLAADEPDGYRSTCQSMVEAFADTDEAATANFTAWTCSLAPDAVEDYSVVLDLAEKACSSNQENDQYVKTLAAIHFRMGEYSVALDQLNKVNDRQATSAAHSNSSPAYTWYLLALTNKADGNHSLAEGFLTKAKQWTADKLAGEDPLAWNRKLTLELLQAEANMSNETSSEGDLLSETAGAPPASRR